MQTKTIFNPIALRKAKIVCNFGLSECSMVNLNLKIVLCLYAFPYPHSDHFTISYILSVFLCLLRLLLYNVILNSIH